MPPRVHRLRGSAVRVALPREVASDGNTVIRYADNLLIHDKRSKEATEVLELTDYPLAELELKLNEEKTRAGSFDEEFKFFGALLEEAIYLPCDPARRERAMPTLPPPLDRLTSLEPRETE